jgi:hypothetical protein
MRDSESLPPTSTARLDRNPDNPPIWVQYAHALNDLTISVSVVFDRPRSVTDVSLSL